jgi:hypothetical protein
MERLRDAMEAEGVLAVRRVVFAGKTVGFRVEMADGSEGRGLTPREAINAAVKVAA